MFTLWKIIYSIFKCCWCFINFIREVILNILLLIFIIVLFGIYSRIYNSSSNQKSALIIDLNGRVIDKPATSDNKLCQFSRIITSYSDNHLKENSLFDIIHKLKQAKKDENITGIVLILKNFTGTDQASLEYIGKALGEFRKSGKPIYAIGDNYSQAQYFLASYANKIYLTPYGSVHLQGIAINNFYYKTLLDKLKIHSHIFRVGSYKSSVEPFLRDNMSDEARQNNSRWLIKLWKNYLDIVSVNRNITPEKLFPDIKIMISELQKINGDTAKLALNNQWIDEIISIDLFEEKMSKIFGKNNRNKKAFNSISIYNYKPIYTLQKGEQIAVISANGIIIDGEKIPGSIDSDTIINQIRDARLDPNIKAILFRINSPGGSVNASESIRAELFAARSKGKPVVISMGSMAASGGYWISTAANHIISGTNTLTGSIGIFGIINTIESSLESIGIYSDGITTSPLADISSTKPLSIECAQKMQINVENGYHNFLSLVSQSRHKTLEEIDKIGQGQVWIGTDALQNNLVDQLGDFDDAVIKTAELAKLKEYRLKWYSNESNVIDFLFKQVKFSLYNPILKTWLIQSMINIDTWSEINYDNKFILNNQYKCYALCLSCKYS